MPRADPLPQQATDASAGMRDWSELPTDIIYHIAEQVAFYPYLKQFASTCKSWCFTTKELICKPHWRFPMVLLPYDKNKRYCAFFRFDDSEIYHLKVPELQNRWICGSSNGWLATLDDNFDMALFNPFTRVQLRLPKHPTAIKTYLKWRDDWGTSFFSSKRWCIEKVVVSDNLVAAIWSAASRLAICFLGDEEWTEVILDDPCLSHFIDKSAGFNDVIIDKGRIYAYRSGFLVIIDYNGSGNVSSKVSYIPNFDEEGYGHIYSFNIVMSLGELLVVEGYKRHEDEDPYPCMTTHFCVRKFEKDERTWTEIYDLGGQSLFLGLNHSLSLPAREFSWCRPNCIYYTDNSFNNSDDLGIGFQWNNGIFSMEDNGVVETLNIEHSVPFWSAPAMWYQQKV